MSNFTLSLKLEAFDRISRPLRNIANTSNRFASNMTRSFDSVRQSASRASRSMSGIVSAGRGMRNIGAGMSLAVTAPLTLMGTAAIRSAASFEQGMNRVRALTGATGEDFERLEQQARDLGETTQFSAREAAGAQGFLAQAGFDAAKILEALPATLILASSAQMDLAESADIVSNVLTGYNLEAAETGRVSDILTAAFTGSNTDLRQLGEAFKLAGPVAAGFGLEIEETSAVLGLMGGAGFQASLGGTALRGVLADINNRTPEVNRRLNQLGADYNNVFDDQGNFRGMLELVQELERTGADAGDMLAIFGQRAGPAMTALVSQGSDALRDFTQDMRESEGVAQRIADIQMEGATGAMTRFRSAWEGFKISLAEDGGGLAVFTRLTNILADTFSWLSDMPAPALTFISVLGGLASVIGPLLVVLGLLGMATGPIAAGFAILISPVGLVIGAIALLAIGAIALIRNWDRVKGFFANLWRRILDFFSNPIQAITTLLLAFNPLALIIRGVNSLVNFLFGIDLLAAGRAMIGGFADGIAERWHSLVAWLSGRIAALVDFMPDWVKDRLGIGRIRIETRPPPSDEFPSEDIPLYNGIPNIAAIQEQQIRNRIDLHVTADGQVRVRELSTGSRRTDINVDTGPLMVGGLN